MRPRRASLSLSPADMKTPTRAKAASPAKSSSRAKPSSPAPIPSLPVPSDVITIRGVRQNNLKGIDLDLPLGKLNVITGPSGSGKSSLAFQTIYAEGQRRYVETFSPYTRQFFDRMTSPRSTKSAAFRPPSPSPRATPCAPRGPPSAP